MDISIIVTTETWLNKSTCDLYSLTNYEMGGQHRDHTSGGGVALFIRNETQYRIHKYLQVFNDYWAATMAVYKVWDEIIRRFPKFSGATTKVW